MNDLQARQVIALLTRIAEEIERLRKAAERHTAPARPDARHVALFLAINAATKARPFSSNELIDHAGFDPALRGALLDALDALSPRKLGRLLRRFEGEDVGGLCIERTAIDSRDGIVWACHESFETRKSSFA
jgi:hypothetical protein